jgi:hypothetical protein
MSNLQRLNAAAMLGWQELVPAAFDPKYNNPWRKRHVLAMVYLTEKGIGPSSEVFIAEDNPGDADLMDTSQLPKPGVCAVTGTVAARCIAGRTHRLATEQEISRFREEQIQREKYCAQLESGKPENRKNTERIVERTVVLSPAEAKRQGIVAERE